MAVAGVVFVVVLVGLVALLGYVLVNDQRRENERRRLTRLQLRDAQYGRRDSNDDERLLWISPPENSDTPEDCAAWFVNRLTVALFEADENRAIRLRSSDLQLLEENASEMSEGLLRKVGKLQSRVSAVLEATLRADTVAARTAGLLDATSRLPLSWTMNHSRALDADPYPVAAQVAAVVANIDVE